MRSVLIPSIVAAIFVVAGTLAFLWLSPEKKLVAAIQTPELIIFGDEDFSGRSLQVTGTLLDMPRVKDELGNEFDWNDNVRSIMVVGGTWRLFQHGRCNTALDDTPLEALDISTKEAIGGWSCLVSPSSSGPVKLTSASGGFYFDISSIELVSDQSLPEWALLK